MAVTKDAKPAPKIIKEVAEEEEIEKIRARKAIDEDYMVEKIIVAVKASKQLQHR